MRVPNPFNESSILKYIVPHDIKLWGTGIFPLMNVKVESSKYIVCIEKDGKT